MYREEKLAMKAMSANMEASVEAMTKDERREAAEARYRAMVKACTRKPGGHVQQPAPADFVAQGGKRLYTVTTIAASIAYGGTRTVVVCDSFERAKEIVETNEGDIWESSYMLAVIEPVACNWLYHYFVTSDGVERYWYRWSSKDRETGRPGGYEAIETPPGYEQVVGFGIG
jgi:hypothetical protein